MFALITVREFAGRLGPLWSSVARKGKDVVSAAVNRRAVWELAYAEDRLLKDIGLTRGDVAAALDEPFYRDPSLNLAAHSGKRGVIVGDSTGSAYLRRASQAMNSAC